MTKTQTRRQSGLTRTQVRRGHTARRTSRARRHLLDLTGFELYAVLAYRLGMGVIALLAVIYGTGH